MTVKKISSDSSIRSNLAVVKVGNSTCPACRDCVAAYNALSSRFSNITFYVVNLDNYIGGRFENVSALSTFFIIVDSRIKKTVVGYDESKLKRYCARYTSSSYNYKLSGRRSERTSRRKSRKRGAERGSRRNYPRH
jgi:hypothetical protein